MVPAFKVLQHEIEELEQMKLALLLPFYTLKYRKQIKAARSEEERKALVPAVEETMKKLLETIQKLRETELLTDSDEEVILEFKQMYAVLPLFESRLALKQRRMGQNC